MPLIKNGVSVTARIDSILNYFVNINCYFIRFKNNKIVKNLELIKYIETVFSQLSDALNALHFNTDILTKRSPETT